jgi:hypothetical protein
VHPNTNNSKLKSENIYPPEVLRNEFEKWFTAYPRREDSGPALKAFSKVIKSG